MEKQYIRNLKELVKFSENIAEECDLNYDIVLSEFGYEYVNSQGQSYEEYVDSLPEDEMEECFEGDMTGEVRVYNEENCPETFPVVIAYTLFSYSTSNPELLYIYVYEHDFEEKYKPIEW